MDEEEGHLLRSERVFINEGGNWEVKKIKMDGSEEHAPGEGGYQKKFDNGILHSTRSGLGMYRQKE